jgi:hypothetical protein
MNRNRDAQKTRRGHHVGVADGKPRAGHELTEHPCASRSPSPPDRCRSVPVHVVRGVCDSVFRLAHRRTIGAYAERAIRPHLAGLRPGMAEAPPWRRAFTDRILVCRELRSGPPFKRPSSRRWRTPPRRASSRSRSFCGVFASHRSGRPANRVLLAGRPPWQPQALTTRMVPKSGTSFLEGTPCSNNKLKRDGGTVRSYPALATVPAASGAPVRKYQHPGQMMFQRRIPCRITPRSSRCSPSRSISFLPRASRWRTASSASNRLW